MKKCISSRKKLYCKRSTKREPSNKTPYGNGFNIAREERDSQYSFRLNVYYQVIGPCKWKSENDFVCLRMQLRDDDDLQGEGMRVDRDGQKQIKCKNSHLIFKYRSILEGFKSRSWWTTTTHNVDVE